MKLPRFSLRSMLIAVAVGCVLCAVSFRVVSGSMAERRAALKEAKRAVLEEYDLYQQFDATRIAVETTSPRSYRVYGKANGIKPLSVVVAKEGDGYKWQYVEVDHTR